MLLKELRTDITIERQILSAMIISDKFMQRFADIIKPVYFENSYIRTISQWILDYYQQHKSAPKMTIRDISDAKIAQNDIDKKEAKLVTPIIDDIINMAASLPDFNEAYHIRTAENYFTSRNMIISANTILNLVNQKQLNEAEKVFSDYHKVAIEVSPIFNPLDDKEVADTFDEQESSFFQFPGEWGKYCGPFERGHLIGICGAFKRGKTWLLQEFVLQAMLQKRRVFFVSLEMTKKKVKERLYKSLTSSGLRPNYTVPCFDCTFNQRNTCELSERTNTYDGPIVDENNATIPYDPDLSDYSVCTECRNRDALCRNFHPSIWYRTLDRPRYEYHYIIDELKAWEMYRQFVRYAVFPRFGASISDINRCAHLLINEEGFEPDIVLIDYGDIVKPEDSRLVGYTKEDHTWMAMAQLASNLNCMVTSPTQVTKAGQTAKNLNVQHQSKWVGIIAHVDAMYSLNQTALEKRMGIMRWGTLAHRHKDFDEFTQLTILQNLHLGQPYIDSAVIVPLKEERNEEEDE